MSTCSFCMSKCRCCEDKEKEQQRTELYTKCKESFRACTVYFTGLDLSVEMQDLLRLYFTKTYGGYQPKHEILYNVIYDLFKPHLHKLPAVFKNEWELFNYGTDSFLQLSVKNYYDNSNIKASIKLFKQMYYSKASYKE